MSPVLERERTRIPVLEREPTRTAVRRRSPILDFTLIILGVLAALAGLYFQFAPSDWWLAHFSEAYQFGSYTLGGLILGAGFGVFADRTVKQDGHPSARSETGIGLALLAVVGALTAVLFWIS
jgi:hypothetical protein